MQVRKNSDCRNQNARREIFFHRNTTHSHSCLEIFAPDEIMIMMIYDAQYVMGRFFYAFFSCS
jgi:hypothetical protein